MKLVTWNINGIRTFKNAIKHTLDSLDADIICLQETKVTRELLEERSAIVDGYNSYFSFSRARGGYSGVATYCKDTATPIAAEEGLTGLLSNHGEAVGCYGDQNAFTQEELQALDSEGRAVITHHALRGPDGPETLTVINVYCPRADPEKPERKLFKLQFYKLLQIRAEAILGPKSHVIVLGDINTSHRPIDHCDPDDVDDFEDNPGRKWLDAFLFGSTGIDEEGSGSRKSGGKFVDAFRRFHPTRVNAFTCWSTLTGARHTNYGTRIDYIFTSCSLTDTCLQTADIVPEMEGSDHCPVWARLGCSVVPGDRCPPLCTRYLPEFAGKQQKLSRFLVKVSDQKTLFRNEEDDALPGSQEAEETRENRNPLTTQKIAAKKRAPESSSSSSLLSSSKDKRSKHSKTVSKPQGSLLNFFRRQPTPGLGPAEDVETRDLPKDSENQGSGCDLLDQKEESEDSEVKSSSSNGSNDQDRTRIEAGTGQGSRDSKTNSCPDFWKAVLRGPPPPPLCKQHNEPCVLRTVKKAGPNLGRQFFVCARPQGHASNPEARCNYFAWVEKK